MNRFTLSSHFCDPFCDPFRDLFFCHNQHHHREHQHHACFPFFMESTKKATTQNIARVLCCNLFLKKMCIELRQSKISAHFSVDCWRWNHIIIIIINIITSSSSPPTTSSVLLLLYAIVLERSFLVLSAVQSQRH